MSITIENNLKSNEASTIGQIHYMPCKIEGDGEASVKKYFDPYIKKLDDGSMTASFRGHPLHGSSTQFPPGYSLSLVTEAKAPLGQESARRLKLMGQADEMVSWGWDTRPSKNDPFYKACQWIKLAEALHEPIEVNE